MIKILDFLKKYKRIFGIGILSVLVLLLNYYWFHSNTEVLKKQLAVTEHNLQVANDTLRVVKDRQGKEEYNKFAYLTNSVENLTKLNKELADEVKKVRGDVAFLSETKVQIVEKKVPFLVRGELLDSNVTSYFNYDTTYSPGNYRKLSGFTKFNLATKESSGEKTTDLIGMKLIGGIKNLDKGKPEIFVKSDYPGFEITSLEGAFIDPNLFKPKKKTPLITPSIFIGYAPIYYNNTDGLKFKRNNFAIGAGLGFNVLKLIGIKE